MSEYPCTPELLIPPLCQSIPAHRSYSDSPQTIHGFTPIPPSPYVRVSSYTKVEARPDTALLDKSDSPPLSLSLSLSLSPSLSLSFSLSLSVSSLSLALFLSLSEAIRTDEGRQDFITEKYIGMKYTAPEDKKRIMKERQESRAESVRRSATLLPQKGMYWVVLVFHIP